MTHSVLLIGIQRFSCVCAGDFAILSQHLIFMILSRPWVFVCNIDTKIYTSMCPLPLISLRVCVCVRVRVLTDISRALGDGKVGASTPSSPLVVPLTAAAVGPRGVVLTLAAQLLFVIYTAVGVKVALAPVKEGQGCSGGRGEGVERGQPHPHE